MSEATARATRRALRRAMGAEATHVVQSNASVLNTHVIPALGSFEARDQELSAELLHQTARITALSQGLKDRAERHATFKGRLRWLLTGR